jgi:hypothetical protein
MNFFTRVVLGLSPVLANAGALYDLTVRPVDQSNLAHVLPTAPTPAVTEYFVEDGKVRHAVNQALPDSGVSAHSNGTTGARLARAAHPVRPARV